MGINVLNREPSLNII